LLRRATSGTSPAGRRRGRFWFETVLALVSAVLSVVTLVVPDWIEAVFNVDPDQHGGTLEWAIAAAFLAAAVTAGALARRERRRPLTTALVMSGPR
jgi:hypothetical protein